MDVISASAPGRAGIVGNPSDMYGGSVVSCSTSERAYCTISPSDTLILEAPGEIAEIKTAEDLTLRHDRLDISKAVIRWFDLDVKNTKIRVSTRTDVPENAGLAGSTALLMTVFACVGHYLGREFQPHEMAESARKVEAGVLGIVCGFQDQYMAVFGGLNYLDFRGKEGLQASSQEPYATVESLTQFVDSAPFVVAHTGIKRHSGQVHRSLRDRWLSGEAAVVAGYERIAELGRLAKKALLRGQWEDMGALMNENHGIQQSLGASGEVNDRLIEVARQNGALGAKLAGAGHGGTIVVLTFEPDTTAAALKEAGADRILYPRPTAGLSVEPSASKG
jgi:galactokinase/mevalonate kinase-like predicted kinase